MVMFRMDRAGLGKINEVSSRLGQVLSMDGSAYAMLGQAMAWHGWRRLVSGRSSSEAGKGIRGVPQCPVQTKTKLRIERGTYATNSTAQLLLAWPCTCLPACPRVGLPALGWCLPHATTV